VLIPYKEGCQRLIGRSIESQRSSTSEKQRLDLKKCNSGKDFLKKRVGALVLGTPEHYNALSKTKGSTSALIPR
jgi:hypothetical protein